MDAALQELQGLQVERADDGGGGAAGARKETWSVGLRAADQDDPLGLEEVEHGAAHRRAVKEKLGLLSKQRVEEIRVAGEERRFDSATSSMAEALNAVQAGPKRGSLLDDDDASSGAPLQNLSVLDQFLIKQNDKTQREGGSFSLAGNLIKKAPGNPQQLASGLSLAAQPKFNKQKQRSHKANKRKEKARERAVGYNERQSSRGGGKKSGPVRRGRKQGRGKRANLLGV